MEKYIYSKTQYLEGFKSLGYVEESGYEKVVRILDEYGSGKIRIFETSSLNVIRLDIILNQDLKINYDSCIFDYKMVLPVKGSITAEKNEHVIHKASKDKLLITVPSGLGQPIPSILHIPKNEHYEAIAINFDNDYLDNVCAEAFKSYWVSIVDKFTDNKNQINCSVDVNFEIKTLFLNLLPDNKLDISNVICINSKIYEIIFKLKELTNQDNFRISEFEKDQIEGLKKYLSNHVFNNDDVINLEILSKKFSINRNKMQKLFKKLYGETIFGYYRRLRLEKAILLLKKNEHTIADIADLLNYNSISGFRLAFKNKYGILPSEINSK